MAPKMKRVDDVGTMSKKGKKGVGDNGETVKKQKTTAQDRKEKLMALNFLTDRYLVKKDPADCSVGDMAHARNQTVEWNGVRTAPSLDVLRRMKNGNQVLLYQMGKQAGIVGIAQVVKEPYEAITDPAILNFALNLECLEAQFYACAATGGPLPASATGGGPAPIGCKKATLTPPTQAIVNEISTDELNHVLFLRKALGSAAVPCPLVDVGPAFAAAADAALNMTLNPPFSPYTNDIFFLHGGFIFEDVGVTAYQGAAPLIANKTYLASAAGILAVEAYHAAVFRTKLTEVANAVVQPYGVPVSAIVQAISNLRAKLSKANDDQGIISTIPGGVNLVPTDSNSLTFARTPGQVLAIVYGMNNASKGLFFPNGTNGAITMSS